MFSERACLVDGQVGLSLSVFGVTSCGGGVSATSKIGVRGCTSVYERRMYVLWTWLGNSLFLLVLSETVA